MSASAATAKTTETPARTVLVTGGNRGIGLAIAEQFLEAGYQVAVTTRSTPAPVDGILSVKADVTDSASVDAAMAEVEEKLGPITVVVANAGITRDTLLMRMSESDFTDVVDTNLTGAFRVVQRATKGMVKARFGRVILISSVVGLLGGAGQVNYSAAKAGDIGFTKALALENAKGGITVNAICPGYINTEMVQAVPKEVLEKSIRPLIPVNRLGEPEEIARAVVFLASDEAGGITGQTLDFNGGSQTR